MSNVFQLEYDSVEYLQENNSSKFDDCRIINNCSIHYISFYSHNTTISGKIGAL